MRKAAAVSRPIIATEFGHSTYTGDWHMPASSYELQAEWIVRSHLLLAAAGLDRVYRYAFQDEGTDRTEPEHCFGVVDWHGKPKPAYLAYRAMTRLLGTARCEGLEPALQAPAYAVRCSVPAGFITAVWDGGGTGEAWFGAAAEAYGLHALTGEEVPLPTAAADIVTLGIDESVRCVRSRRPLSFRGQRRTDPPVAPQVQMTLTPTTIRVRPGAAAAWTVQVSNGYGCAVQLGLSSAHPWGGPRPQSDLTPGPAAEAKVPMSIEVPGTAKGTIVS
jgi:hypothetical protein